MSCLNPQTRKSASNFTQISQFDAQFQGLRQAGCFFVYFRNFFAFYGKFGETSYLNGDFA